MQIFPGMYYEKCTLYIMPDFATFLASIFLFVRLHVMFPMCTHALEVRIMCN